MRLLLIATDRTIFQEGSAVRARISRLGATIGELDIIIFSTRAHGVSSPQEIAPGIRAYPTNSLSRLLYGLDAIRIARKLSHADVISAQDPFETGLAALCVSHLTSSKLAIEMHTDFLSSSFAKHSILNRLRLVAAGFVLRCADGGYAVLGRVRDAAVLRYGLTKQFAVLPIYVDVGRFAEIQHEPHSRFATSLLWVGRLESEKNPALALDAFSTARSSCPNLGLTYVGDGRELEMLRARVMREGLSEYVEFVGAVTDVSSYYARADLLLVTSAYEGFGMVIVEALAAGVPVLSTDVGVAREAGAVIANGIYHRALTEWLGGPREKGVLKIRPYKSEGEYYERLRELYSHMSEQV